MLYTIPGGQVGFRQLTMWKKMKPMEPTMFKRYWNVVGMKKYSTGWHVDPMTDPENAQYEEWTDRHGHAFKGLRKLVTEKDEMEQRHRMIPLPPKEQGIIRMVESGGNISEETRSDGQYNGLRRWITEDKVHLILYDKGEKLAAFSFDHGFKPITRSDGSGTLKDLTPETFMKDAIKLMLANESD